MERFIVCMGGSGSKVLESLTHMAAMNAWNQDNFHVLVIDVDGGNGNQERANKTVLQYNALQKMNLDHELFQSKIELYSWMPLTENKNLGSYEAGKSQNIKLVSSFLFSKSERNMTVDCGFKGHPNIGVLFMQTILDKLNPKDDNNLNSFVAKAKEEKADRIFVIGSCYGGTGAACIPVMGRYLKKELKVPMGLLAMLPTFSVTKAATAEEDDPDSNEFRDRVKTVLSTYISQEILLYEPEGKSEKEPIYEKIYLLGSPEPIAFEKYAVGTSAQENPSTFFDWFACTAVKNYIDKANDAELKTQEVYTGWIDPGPWDWKLFDAKIFPNLQKKATKLLIAVGLYMVELHVPVVHFSSDGSKKKQKDNILCQYFAEIQKEDYTKVENCFEPLALYGSLLVLWFYQIVTCLPREMFKNSTTELPSKMLPEEKMKNMLKEKNTNPPDAQIIENFYYQRFIHPVVLYRMELLRQKYWPRGHEEDERGKENRSLTGLVMQIYKDYGDVDEEKQLGSLLPMVTYSRYYHNKTSDKLMGWMLYDRCDANNAEEAAEGLIRKLFKAIDD